MVLDVIFCRSLRWLLCGVVRISEACNCIYIIVSILSRQWCRESRGPRGIAVIRARGAHPDLGGRNEAHDRVLLRGTSRIPWRCSRICKRRCRRTARACFKERLVLRVAVQPCFGPMVQCRAASRFHLEFKLRVGYDCVQKEILNQHRGRVDQL